MIKRNWKRIVSILILIVMFFPHISIYAITQERAGQIIAGYAYDFCKNYGSSSSNNQTIYDWSDNRKYGYRLEICPSGTAEGPKGTKAFSNKYPMDCVGFVSTVIHQSLGIGNNDWEVFISPQTTTQGYFSKVTTGDWKPGDILHLNTYNESTKEGTRHVMVYLGDMGGYKVAHSVSGEFKGASLGNNTSGYSAYRLNPDVCTAIDETNCKVSAGASLVGLGSSSMGTESEFYYNGVPDGKYSVAGSFFEWIVQALAEVFKFLVNIIFYIFRMVFVGFTAIVDNLITYVVRSITGDDTASFFKDATSGWRDDGKEVPKVNIETIIFDDTFDVNFFAPATTTP